MVGVGVEHLYGVDIERHMVAVAGELPEYRQKGVEVCDGIECVEWKEGLDGVTVTPEGVGTYDDALLRCVIVHFGAIVLWVGAVGDAARLAEVAFGRRWHVGVRCVRLHKSRLLPVEEVGIVVVGGNPHTECVVASYCHPLRCCRRVGEETVRPPVQAVCPFGTGETVAYRVVDMHRVGHQHGIRHRDGGRTHPLYLCFPCQRKQKKQNSQ